MQGASQGHGKSIWSCALNEVQYIEQKLGHGLSAHVVSHLAIHESSNLTVSGSIMCHEIS